MDPVLQEGGWAVNNPALVDGLRGVQSPESGSLLRQEQDPRYMAGPGITAGSPPNNPAPKETRPSRQQATHNVGHNIKISKSGVDQALLSRTQEVMLSRGIQVPKDILDYQNRATVYYMAANGMPVDVDHVVITWEEG